MNFEEIIKYFNRFKFVTYPLSFLILDLIASIIISNQTDFRVIPLFFLIILGGIIIFALYRLVKFYLSPSRLEHEFNAFYAGNFLSNFYRIYFPVIIAALVIRYFLTLAWLPQGPNSPGFGLIDHDTISSSGFFVFIAEGIVIGLGVMALSDYEMKQKNLLYAPRGQGISKVSTFAYVFSLLGLYFGITFFLRFIISQVLGSSVLIPPGSNVYEIDTGIIRGFRFWQFLTDVEKYMTFIGFIIVYIALEIFLRGYLGNEARAYRLGAAGMVFVPAFVQAFAFSNGIFVFSAPIYYFYNLLELFLFGTVLGIILWRTKRFGTLVISALLARLLDSRSDFQTNVLFMLPESFGEYNPTDSIPTLADTIGLNLIYIQIGMVVISPFIVIVGYEEVWKIVKNLYSGLKNQWFGYLVLGIGFFIIDLVFSFVTTILGPLLGFIIALLILGIVLNTLFKVLPQPTEMPQLHSDVDMFEGELPLNLIQDIEYLERTKKWYENPRKVGFVGAFTYLYFLFLSATYRQFVELTPFEILKFVIFLIILPTVLLSITAYLFSKAYYEGYFFSENWRTTLFWILGALFVINVLIWTSSSSTVNFNWRNIPLISAFVLLVWPKPIEKPTRDYALGLARAGRYATFRWLEKHPNGFKKEFDNLIELPSENVTVGAYIVAAKERMLEVWNLIEFLRSGVENRSKIIGSIMALGILKSESAEGVILDYLNKEDQDIKIAALWTLGQLGSNRSLNKMAKILEENPKKDLIKIGEKSILRIDPNFPLAGLRDSIVIEAN